MTLNDADIRMFLNMVQEPMENMMESVGHGEPSQNGVLSIQMASRDWELMALGIEWMIERMSSELNGASQ